VNDLRQAALKLLARREHSRAELARKLACHGEADEIDSVLNDLQQSGLLSDRRFAESYARVRGPRLGVARLRHDLAAKGVAGELVDACLKTAELPDELERARGVWRKKFAEAPRDAREWARQARFLQGRGFSTEVIRRVLKDEEAGR
jgi:regulatory protein